MARAMRASGEWKPNAIAGEKSDLGVDRFDPAVGQAVFDGGEDRGPVFHDPSLQLDERVDAAAAGPADPPVQRRGCLGGVETEDQPQAFLEQVGPVQPWVGLGDPGQLRLLPAGQVLRVLPQRIPGSLSALWRDRLTVPPGDRVTAPRATIPGLPTDLVECFGGPVHDMERIGAADRLRARFRDHGRDPVRAVSGDMGDRRAAAPVRAGRRTTARVPCRARVAAHTSRPESWSTTTVRYLWSRL